MNQTPDINGDKILIKGYIKADGTKVSSYWRRLPGKALLTIFNGNKSQSLNGFVDNDPYSQMDDKGFLERLKAAIEEMPESEARDNLLNVVNKFDGFGVMQDGKTNDSSQRLAELKQKITEIINYLPEGKVKNALLVTNSVAQGLMSWDGVWTQLPEDADAQTKEILKQELEFVVKSVCQMVEGDFLEVDWGHLVQTLGISEALNAVNPILGQVVTIAADVVPKVINIVKASKGEDKDLLKIMTNALGLLPSVGSVFGQIGAKVGEKILENPKLNELYRDLKGIDTVSKRFDAYIKNDMPEGSIKELERIGELSDGLQNKAYQLEGSVEASNELKNLRQKLFQPTQMTGAAAPVTLKGGVDNYDELFQQQDLILLKNLYPDIMSQVDVGQLPTNINNFNPMQIIDNFRFNINKNINNYLKDYKNTNLNEKLQGIAYENVLHPFLPMAANSTRNGMHNLNEAKIDTNAKIYENINEVKDKKVVDFLQNTVKVPKNVKGINYNAKSYVSQNLGNSPEISKFIIDNFEALEDNKISQAPIEWKFTPWNGIKGFDRFFAFQHATIMNPKIDSNGVFTAKIIDYTDFEYRNGKSVTNIPNNWGYNMQEKGNYKNYFNVIEIERKLR